MQLLRLFIVVELEVQTGTGVICALLNITAGLHLNLPDPVYMWRSSLKLAQKNVALLPNLMLAPNVQALNLKVSEDTSISECVAVEMIVT